MEVTTEYQRLVKARSSQETFEIRCKVCGVKQEAQAHSYCRRHSICLDCANEKVNQSKGES